MSHNPIEYYSFDPHNGREPGPAGSMQPIPQCIAPTMNLGPPLQSQPLDSVMQLHHQQQQPQQHQAPQQPPQQHPSHPQIALVAPAIHHPQIPHSLGMQQQQQQPPAMAPSMEEGMPGGLMPNASLPGSMPPSVSSSVIRALSGASQQRPRSEKKPIPEDMKDEKYCERRKRNNLAAKKSRDARKQREDEIAIRASFLEKENAILRAQVATLRDEANSLRQILLTKRTGHT